MNSMKEDINILEDKLKLNATTKFDWFGEKEFQALEHLIKAYKELKEIEENHRQENGKLRERVKELEENINKQKQLTKIAQTITDESIKEALIEFEKDYIPVSLVEEMIKELKEMIDSDIESVGGVEGFNNYYCANECITSWIDRVLDIVERMNEK